MFKVRRNDQIHEKEGGWFHARWHFSFDDYRDPEWTSFGSLRVFNDDRLVPGAIWPLHPHRDIEGITYVVEGTFRHEDDLGTGGILPAGSVQRMTLGSGAWHSEQNGSDTEPMRFIQMWILPAERGLPPSVEQRVYTEADRTDRLLQVLSSHGGDAVKVHQDASVFVSSLAPGSEVSHDLPPGRGAYLYIIRGTVKLGDDRMFTGDAAAVSQEAVLPLAAEDPTELIMVDVRLDR